MSIANKRRNQGSEDEYSDLLIKGDCAEEGDVDMAVQREERDQREQAPPRRRVIQPWVSNTKNTHAERLPPSIQYTCINPQRQGLVVG